MGGNANLPMVVPFTYTSQTVLPATHFVTDNVPAPTVQYVTDDTTLQLQFIQTTSLGGVVINYKLLRSSDGQIVTFQQSLLLNQQGTVIIKNIQLEEGFLLGVSVSVSGSISGRGLCFVVGT